MKKLKKWLLDRKVNKALVKVRADIQAIWDTADRRRHPFKPETGLGHVLSTPDRWRPIEDYMKESERNKYEELCSTDWHFSTYLGVKSVWGNSKYLTKVLGENSPPALMTVKEDHSTKLTYEYDETLDGYVPCRNGKRPETFMLRKVVKDGQQVLGEDGEQLTEELPAGFEPRESFEKHWKKHPDFDRLYKEWMENTNGIG